MDERLLLEKLRKIEALIAQPGTAGEGAAAAEARRRLMERLSAIRKTDASVEYRFSIPDAWSRRLFLALLRRYGLQPYRHRGQRYSTVTVRAPKSFLEETLWPEFLEMSTTLKGYLDEVTDRVIGELFQQKPEEAGEAPQELLGVEAQ
ncbi:MAG TPA: hypothetical protein VGP72_11335 [Planctomycetota bacterium]|jgi:hypothetical protein